MSRWQARQFPQASTQSALKHLTKEVREELPKSPDDPEEWADAFHLAVQGGVKAAGSEAKFFAVVWLKLDVNMNYRKWQEPDADNVYEHVRPHEKV